MIIQWNTFSLNPTFIKPTGLVQLFRDLGSQFAHEIIREVLPFYRSLLEGEGLGMVDGLRYNVYLQPFHLFQ